MHAPIRTYHALNGFPSHRLRHWDSDRQIKDGAPLAGGRSDFPQGWGKQLAFS
jgi:hypothetical protein